MFSLFSWLLKFEFVVHMHTRLMRSQGRALASSLKPLMDLSGCAPCQGQRFFEDHLHQSKHHFRLRKLEMLFDKLSSSKTLTGLMVNNTHPTCYIHDVKIIELTARLVLRSGIPAAAWARSGSVMGHLSTVPYPAGSEAAGNGTGAGPSRPVHQTDGLALHRWKLKITTAAVYLGCKPSDRIHPSVLRSHSILYALVQGSTHGIDNDSFSVFSVVCSTPASWLSLVAQPPSRFRHDWRPAATSLRYLPDA